MGRVSILYLLLLVCCFAVLQVRSYLYKEKYIDVPVDHFNYVDQRTFALRYCVNDSFWEPNRGPVLFYPGNEAAIETFVENTGFLWEAAIKLRALVVFAEHRFYGKSMPFGNLSFTDNKYYSYLTTQQALADYVDIIYQLREQRKNATKAKSVIPNPVIAIGGSYGGMLAAWMRMKYPAVVQGALASSAPIWGFVGMVPCDAFSTKLTSLYSNTHKLCSKNIRTFWDELARVSNTEAGRLWLSKTWKLCNPLKTTDDVNRFRQLLEEMFAAVAMVNYPYPTHFLKPLPANPIKEMCLYLTSPNLTADLLVETMSQVASIYFNHTGSERCFNWTTNAYQDIGVDGWNIQTCLDMVMPFCSNGQTDMFRPTNWTFQDWDKECYSKYRLHPVQNIAEKLYGGKNIDAASNIIFSNGELDPWISGGVTHYKLSPSITTIVLPKAAHHLDLRAKHEHDPFIVKWARKMYEKIFAKWIKTYYKRYNELH